MKHLIDQGQRGAEQLGNLARPDTGLVAPVDPFLDALKQLPTTTVSVERDDGVKVSIEVVPLSLKSEQTKRLVHVLAAYEPTVFARVGGWEGQGMLSANYDEHGGQRLPAIKVIPLNEPLLHDSRGIPDAGGVTMLGGAVSLERPGVGGHGGDVSKEVEHRASVLGAVSVGRPELAKDHDQHSVRKAGSSVATGLTDGSLGNLYIPGENDFQGFGSPALIDERNAASATIFVPRSYLDHPDRAFGSLIDIDPTRTLLGVGLSTLVTHRGSTALSEVQQLGEELRAL